MKKEKETVQDNDVTLIEPVEIDGSAEPKRSKFRRFWDYVNDYNRKTVALTLPSIAFDIVYSSFCAMMSVFSRSLWLLIMAIYYFLLSMLRINVLYRAGRGALFKGKRFSERKNVFAYNVYLIVRNKVIHDYPGILVYAFGIYVIYKVLLAVINVFKAHRSKSLTALSLRKIGIVEAMVSALALEWAFSHRDEGNLSLFAI